MLRKFTLLAFSQGKLRPEDKCGILRLANSCQDMSIVINDILRDVGR